MCVEDSDCLYWAFIGFSGLMVYSVDTHYSILGFAGACELKANCGGGIFDDPDSVSGEKGCVAK